MGSIPTFGIDLRARPGKPRQPADLCARQAPTEGAGTAARGQRLHDFAVVKPVWACNVAEPRRILAPTMGRKPARDTNARPRRKCE